MILKVEALYLKDDIVSLILADATAKLPKIDGHHYEVETSYNYGWEATATLVEDKPEAEATE